MFLVWAFGVLGFKTNNSKEQFSVLWNLHANIAKTLMRGLRPCVCACGAKQQLAYVSIKTE